MHVSKCSSIYFLIIAAISSNVHAARILGLFPHTGKSHFMVYEPYLRKLTERGHHVSSVSFFPLENPPGNYTDISLQGMSSLGIESVDLLELEELNTIPKMLGFQRIVEHMQTFEPLDGIALELCEKLVDFPRFAEALKQHYDLIIMEYFHSDCMLGLMHVYGVEAPLVALSSTGFIPWLPDRIGVADNPAYVPSVSAFFTSKMSFWQRIENTFLQLYHKHWYRNTIQLKEQEIIERRFGKTLPDLKELAKKVSLILFNTHHSLNGVRPLLPGVVEVGGMHLNFENKPIPNVSRYLNINLNLHFFSTLHTLRLLARIQR